MTAMLATLSAAFAKFYGREVLGYGLKRLPAKVSPCISHGPAPGECS
ncbi:MAG: hypothetical protein JST16_07445 [Bdellovibrionales bacterium]|nr:hypothetical protein [Bdellovibrionales bacterium]